MYQPLSAMHFREISGTGQPSPLLTIHSRVPRGHLIPPSPHQPHMLDIMEGHVPSSHCGVWLGVSLPLSTIPFGFMAISFSLCHARHDATHFTPLAARGWGAIPGEPMRGLGWTVVDSRCSRLRLADSSHACSPTFPPVCVPRLMGIRSTDALGCVLAVGWGPPQMGAHGAAGAVSFRRAGPDDAAQSCQEPQPLGAPIRSLGYKCIACSRRFVGQSPP